MKPLLRVVLRGEGVVAAVEAALLTVLMVVMFVAGIAQVVIRSAGMRSAGTDEITSLSLAVLVFVGAGLVVYTADNIAIEVLEFLPSERARTALRVVGIVAVGVFAVVFGYYALDFAGRVGEERTLQLGLPVLISAGSMVAGAALMLLHTLGSLARLLGGDDLDPPWRRWLLSDSPETDDLTVEPATEVRR